MFYSAQTVIDLGTFKEKKIRIALVDADVFVYRTGFASEDVDENIAKARLVEWFTDVVYINCKADDYKAYITGKSNYRYDVAKTVPYKGNRKDMKKPKHYDFLRDVLVRRLGAEVTDGIEADDAVAIASAEDPSAIIVHVDKDLDQLPGKHYNPNKDLHYEVSEIEGLRNFYKQMLVGDRTDNIEGVPKIGPVKAGKWLDNKQTEQEMLQQVWELYQQAAMSQERLIENGQLLWLQRKPGQMWLPPFALQGVSGK